MFTKEEAYSQVALLTKRFAEQLTSYKRSDYNETLTRRDFIDPFFKALGWDVDNSQGYAEAYREVIQRIAYINDNRVSRLMSCMNYRGGVCEGRATL